MFFSAPLFC